jgi:hypothetical protein
MLMLFGPGDHRAIEDIPTQTQCEVLKARIAPEGMCVKVNKFVNPRRTVPKPRPQSIT